MQFQPTLDIPATLHSSATIIWIGFNSNTADVIINKWEWLSRHPMTERPLQQVIEDYLRFHPIAEPCGNTNEGDWYVAMQQLGISTKMQEAVMDPEHNVIRKMHPLRHWLEEFIVSNYLSLTNVEERIRLGINICLATDIRSTIDIRLVIDIHLVIDIRSAMDICLATEDPLSVQHTLRGKAGGVRGDYSDKPQGFTTLYHATTAGRLKNVFKENGTIDLTQTMPGPRRANDFGFDNYGVMFYWTPRMWVAEAYAQYCERAIGFKWDVVVLMMIARPYDIRIEDATWELEYSDTWRKLLWYSRNRVTYPEDISERYKKTDVFIGPISATSVLNQLSNWQQITEDHVLKQYGDHGDQAIQYVWKGMHAMAYMNGRCTIDLFR